jgi:hypothetical protein
MVDDVPERTARERGVLVVSILKGKRCAAEAACERAMAGAEAEDWRDRS